MIQYTSLYKEGLRAGRFESSEVEEFLKKDIIEQDETKWGGQIVFAQIVHRLLLFFASYRILDEITKSDSNAILGMDESFD